MKRVIVIVLLLILIGGGGAGALIILGVLPNPFNPAKQGQSAALLAAEKAEAAAKQFKEPSAAMTFVDLRDMIIPVVIGNNTERKVYFSVRLHVEKEAKKDIEDNISRYENAVIRDFIPYFQKYFAKNNLLNLREIKSILNASAKKLYGDKVIDVVLINIFEQRFGTLN
ncbi:MAG: hypothetical protein EXR11_03915 [Rhodospirillaceae bacterium]|nr:hypothetical protein [Rhodospirillaceae bacterium]